MAIRLLLITFTLVLTGAGAVSGPARAQETPVPDGFFSELGEEHAGSGEDPHGEHGAHEAEHQTGLPQLDPSTYPSQIFWLIVTFSALYFVLSRRILPDISSALDTRLNHIQGDLDESENLKSQAQAAHDAYERILNEARQKSTKLFDDIEADVQKKANKEYNNFHDRMEKEIKLTEARLEKVKKEARTEMDTVAAEIAALAAEKIIGVSADIDQIKIMIKDLNGSKAKAA